MKLAEKELQSPEGIPPSAGVYKCASGEPELYKYGDFDLYGGCISV